jgi:hypothetical protein
MTGKQQATWGKQKAISGKQQTTPETKIPVGIFLQSPAKSFRQIDKYQQQYFLVRKQRIASR